MGCLLSAYGASRRRGGDKFACALRSANYKRTGNFFSLIVLDTTTFLQGEPSVPQCRGLPSRWNERRCRFRHLATGFYLTVCPERDDERKMHEEQADEKSEPPILLTVTNSPNPPTGEWPLKEKLALEVAERHASLSACSYGRSPHVLEVTQAIRSNSVGSGERARDACSP